MIFEGKGKRRKVKGARYKDIYTLYLVPCTFYLKPCPLRQRGFTLLELIVVLFVVVLGFSAIGLNLSSGSDSTKIKAAARDIVSALRYARGQALMTHEEATVTIDLGNNSYTVSGRDKIYEIPEDIDITVVTAQNELTGEGQANIRFFADGSSTGGRVTLERGQTAWKIDINWLTGQPELENE
ncbi:type II secretion system protein GspH [Candidatus Methylobacter oryzae]|uniref:Type II secretion system protein H n=1 Tax=Candidatus Methylobacter oryzae TaxID=2497749 RepID=A0ABY3C5N9_9GAMM|nr:type II secretion system protein GspH [Candidatus Methylobacter oryzae]